MTVIIPPRQYSREERQQLVLEYLEQPFGSKAQFLQGHQIAQHRMYRWRKALADGDLDTGQVPRKTGVMTRREAAEVRRLQAEIDRLNEQLASERKVVDALGKAISVMHDLGVADDAEDQDGTRKNKPGTSS
ncbi:transposase [Citricoccus sp. NPDC079358]|uniref:transposase n=1 Tax=Citricoccus sp. NPDC079358 TaxID=3154653 RepID=UPI00344F39D6